MSYSKNIFSQLTWKRINKNTVYDNKVTIYGIFTIDFFSGINVISHHIY